MSDEHEDSPKAPNLQEWVARYGGYPNIPWTKWDAAVAKFQSERREVLGGERSENRSK